MLNGNGSITGAEPVRDEKAQNGGDIELDDVTWGKWRFVLKFDKLRIQKY